MSEKIKVQSRHVATRSSAADYTAPLLNTIATKIVLQDNDFLPVYDDKNTSLGLKAYLPLDPSNVRFPVQLPHRSTVAVNCGFSMTLPAGFKAAVVASPEMAARGLMVVPAIYEDKVEVYVTNVGREIVVLNHGDIFARMTIEPIYQVSWEK